MPVPASIRATTGTADLRALHTVNSVYALLRSPETTSGDSGTASPLKNL